MRSSDCAWSRHAIRSGDGTNSSFDRSSDVAIHTRRSGLGYDSGRTSTALTTLNTAVVRPMPSASVSITTALNAGVRRSIRSP